MSISRARARKSRYQRSKNTGAHAARTAKAWSASTNDASLGVLGKYFTAKNTIIGACTAELPDMRESALVSLTSAPHEYKTPQYQCEGKPMTWQSAGMRSAVLEWNCGGHALSSLLVTNAGLEELQASSRLVPHTRTSSPHRWGRCIGASTQVLKYVPYIPN